MATPQPFRTLNGKLLHLSHLKVSNRRQTSAVLNGILQGATLNATALMVPIMDSPATANGNLLHNSRVKNKIVTFEEVRDKIVDIRGQQVIPDFVVADFYGVETKRINEAVKNNPAKFPSGYLIELDNQESKSLRSKISTLESDGGKDG